MSASSGITTTINEKDWARIDKRLVKYQGRLFQDRMEAVFRLALGPVVRVMKARAPVGPRHTGVYPRAGGMTKATISIRKRKPPPGYFVQYGVKPRARHSHFASQGVRPHTLAPRSRVLQLGGSEYLRLPSGWVGLAAEIEHPGSRPVHGKMLFVEQTIQSEEPSVLRFIRSRVTSEGITPMAIGGALRDYSPGVSLSPGVSVGW